MDERAANGSVVPAGDAVGPVAIRLGYEEQSGRKRRRRRRRLAALLALCSVATAAWWYREPLRRYGLQGHYLYRQWRCLAHEAPADHVAYEDDPDRAAALLATGSEYRSAVAGRPTPGQITPVTPVGHVPRVMDDLSPGWVCMLVVGSMKTPGGHERLAAVGIQVLLRGDGGRTMEIYGSGKRLADWTPNSTASGYAVQKLRLNLSPSDRLTIHSGRAVPGDPSRCTFRYVLNGVAGTIEGRLSDGQETIVLLVMSGPAEKIATTGR